MLHEVKLLANAAGGFPCCLTKCRFYDVALYSVLCCPRVLTGATALNPPPLRFVSHVSFPWKFPLLTASLDLLLLNMLDELLI